MKQTPLLSVILAGGIFVGFLFLFPWEWVVLLFALSGLATALVVLVRRHMRVVPAGDSLHRAVTPQAATPPPPGGEAPAEAIPQPGPQPNLDSELFSRFRAHLESAENRTAGAASAGPAAAGTQESGAAPAPAGEVEDRVVLSPAARAAATRSAAASVSPPAEPTREEEERDLFADLRPQPTATGAEPTPPAAEAPAPATTDEIQAALEGAEHPDVLAQEGDNLLRLAQEAYGNGDHEGAQAGLAQYQTLLADKPQLVHWQGGLLDVRLALHAGELPRALVAFDAMLKRDYPLTVENLPALADELTALAKLEDPEASTLRVSMLQKMLAVFRRNRDRPAMDRAYELIEEAQERAGNERKLLRFLKNHLEIKKVMGDTAGQLALIDQIGNRYFKLGDSDSSKTYYEMGLKLRGEQESQAGEPQPERDPEPNTA